MRLHLLFSGLFGVFCLLGACQETHVEEIPTFEDKSEWLIPLGEVRDGGPGKDGIPALENPEFITQENATYLKENDLVLGFAHGDDIRAYSHPILDWHEIINDEVNGLPLAITYCPLTGTGIAWERTLNGQVTTFGVSGLLYNTNLMPYDRATNSTWSQLRLDCVNGELIRTQIKTFPLLETTWKTWKELYPNAPVISSNTGYDRPYEFYPYGDYKTNQNRLLFPVNRTDDRLPQKERVHGIIVDGWVRVYQLNQLSSQLQVIEDNFRGEDVVLVGSLAKNLLVSYKSRLPDGTKLTFELLENQLPLVLQDQEGTQWDIFGRAIHGKRKGEQLTATHSFMGFWFAWAAFYPNIEIYQF